MQRTLPEARLARDAGIHLIVVTLGGAQGAAGRPTLEIQGLATHPAARNTFSVRRYAQLPGIITSVIGAMCNSESR